MTAPAAAPEDLSPLGPHELFNPGFVALKAGLVCLAALLLSRLLGNPDTVSAAFVGVLCSSPTVLIGLRQARDQMLGGLFGGVLGVGFLALGTPALAGVPLAVGLSVAGSFGLGIPQGYTAAAFSALFVQLVPQGGPGETLGTRALALGIAAVCGFLGNLLVSSHAYRFLFVRRLRKVERHAEALLARAPARGPRSVQPGFALLGALEGELAQAVEELRWRRNTRDLAWVEKVLERVDAIHHLLHLVWDLGLLAEEHALEPEALRPLLEWAAAGEGAPPQLGEPLATAAGRLERAWGRLKQIRVGFPER